MARRKPLAPADPNAEATAALQRAAMNGDMAQVSAAIAARVPLDAPGDSRMTALGIAALYGRADVIRALTAAGASVAADQDGESALTVAAHEGHVAAVDALLAAGANVNYKDRDGITPLMSAASSNRAGAIRSLLAKGADVNADQQRWGDGAHRRRLWRTRAGHRRAARRRRRDGRPRSVGPHGADGVGPWRQRRRHQSC